MKMDDSGQLSLDFLIGFTIFLIAFIIVITMASGLLVSLMSRTVDYDAVAYRSGVILVEDPGWALDPVSNEYTTKWELINPSDREDILRAGLALSKNYPGILTETKINEFFDQMAPGDIHQKVLFDSPVYLGGISQYSYRYNINLSEVDGWSPPKEIGDPVPTDRDTGYIKRVVKIKKSSHADITPVTVGIPPGAATGDYIVYLNMTDLYKYDPLHRIDPRNENITISLDLTGIADASDPTQFLGVSFYYDNPPLLPDSEGDTLIEGNLGPFLDIPDSNTLILTLTPRFFYEKEIDPGKQYYFKFSFDPLTIPLGDPSLNYDYNYGYPMPAAPPNPAIPGADQPALVPAVLEVRTW